LNYGRPAILGYDLGMVAYKDNVMEIGRVDLYQNTKPPCIACIDSVDIVALKVDWLPVVRVPKHPE
jgi:hypothetical protein